MVAQTAEAARTRVQRSEPLSIRLWGVVASLVVLAIAVALSLAIGTRQIPLATVIGALSGTAEGTDAEVVLTLRVPRTVLGLLVGIGLGVAGAIIQAVTRNPLAEPGILGVTYGASFAVAIAVGVLGVTAASGYVWFAFLGALAATIAVFLIGASGRGTVSPARIVLAGVALGAVLNGIVTAMTLADPQGFNAMRAWEAGSLADRGWNVIVPVAPFIGLGLLVAALLARPLNAVALGDDLAAALGARVMLTRVGAVAAITLLAGGATAMAGPLLFVGLMIPHLARWIVGPDQRWILLLTALLGPVLVLVADVIGRVILWPAEVEVGIVTAFLGAPVLIALVRRQKASSL